VVESFAAVPSFARAGAWALNPGEYYSELKAGRFFADTYYDHAAVRFVTPVVAVPLGPAAPGGKERINL